MTFARSPVMPNTTNTSASSGSALPFPVAVVRGGVPTAVVMVRPLGWRLAAVEGSSEDASARTSPIPGEAGISVLRSRSGGAAGTLARSPGGRDSARRLRPGGGACCRGHDRADDPQEWQKEPDPEEQVVPLAECVQPEKDPDHQVHDAQQDPNNHLVSGPFSLRRRGPICATDSREAGPAPHHPFRMKFSYRDAARICVASPVLGEAGGRGVREPCRFRGSGNSPFADRVPKPDARRSDDRDASAPQPSEAEGGLSPRGVYHEYHARACDHLRPSKVERDQHNPAQHQPSG